MKPIDGGDDGILIPMRTAPNEGYGIVKCFADHGAGIGGSIIFVAAAAGFCGGHHGLQVAQPQKSTSRPLLDGQLEDVETGVRNLCFGLITGAGTVASLSRQQSTHNAGGILGVLHPKEGRHGALGREVGEQLDGLVEMFEADGCIGGGGGGAGGTVRLFPMRCDGGHGGIVVVAGHGSASYVATSSSPCPLPLAGELSF